MSLHNLARKVQDTGRGQDSMLVHMSPREVSGLQALARQHGGSLTTNPKTGLPEAGFLEEILPMVAAGAAIYFTAGAAAPALMSAGMGATSAGILAGAGAGAAIGAGSAAIQGKDVGQAALMGGATGAIGGYMGAPGEVPTGGTENVIAKGVDSAAANAPLQQATTVGTNAINVNPSTGMAIDPLTGASNVPSGGIGPGSGNVPQGQMPPANVNANVNANINPTVAPSAPTANGLPPGYNPSKSGLTLSEMQMGSGRPELSGQVNTYDPYAKVAGEPPIGAKPSTATSDFGKWWENQSPWEKAGYSTLGAGLVAGFNAPPGSTGAPDDDYTSPLKRISPNFQAQQPVQPNPYYRARYPVYAAQGGLMSLADGGGPVERMSNMNTALNPQGGMYPQGMIDKTQYATPSQRPTSMEVVESQPSYAQRVNPMTGTLLAGGGDVTKKKKQAADLTPESKIAAYDPYRAGIAMANNARNQASLTGMEQIPAAMQTLGGVPVAAGGGLASLGGYSDGGRLLKGPGDGMSDNIPATIGRKQPARLADGEFVIPADVVSHLGNGSTDAGAKRLYAMMDRARQARTGKKKQAPAVNADKLLSRIA